MSSEFMPSDDKTVQPTTMVTQAEKTAAVALNPSETQPMVSHPHEASSSKAEHACQNCGHRLEGPFCGMCGQPERSVLRFFGSVVMHFLDDIFGWDTRASRTIVPLMFRPGFLTNEYFRGRRVHYVPPLRLYFIVSIIFFLALEFFTGDSVKDLVELQQHNGQQLTQLRSEVETLQQKMAQPGYVHNEADAKQLAQLLGKRDKARKGLEQSIKKMQKEIDEIKSRQAKPGYVAEPADDIQLAAFTSSLSLMKLNLVELPVEEKLAEVERDIIALKALELQSGFVDSSQHQKIKAQLEEQKESLEQQLAQRQKVAQERQQHSELEAPGKQKGLVGVKVNDKGKADVSVSFGEGFAFLSDEQNKRLQAFGQQLEKKAKVAFEQDAGPLVKQILGVLPQTMFVLLPIFALLLKLLYLFSGRLYMEHLTVALHSHAFIFVNLLMMAILSTLFDVINNPYPQVAEYIEYVIVGFALWIPAYLFLMQKRVYQQGLFFTIIKFVLVGFCYIALLIMTMSVTFIWGLANL